MLTSHLDCAVSTHWLRLRQRKPLLKWLKHVIKICCNFAHSCTYSESRWCNGLARLQQWPCYLQRPGFEFSACKKVSPHKKDRTSTLRSVPCSGHSSQGSQGCTTPFNINKNKFNTFLPSFSSPTQENIFVFTLLCVKV